MSDLQRLFDEIFTPDSSRFWPADQYQPGRDQPSFDKQYVRDWLIESGWDKSPETAPELPAERGAVDRNENEIALAAEMFCGGLGDLFCG